MQSLFKESHYYGSSSTYLVIEKASQLGLKWKTSPILSSSNLDWFDTQYRYSVAEDILMIYFIKLSKGMVKQSDPVYDDIIGDFDDKKLLSLEILNASEVFNCHFFDTTTPIEGRQPFALSSKYNKQEDEYLLFFSGEIEPKYFKEVKSTDHHFVYSYYSGDILKALKFKEASKHIRTNQTPKI